MEQLFKIQNGVNLEEDPEKTNILMDLKKLQSLERFK